MQWRYLLSLIFGFIGYLILGEIDYVYIYMKNHDKTHLDSILYLTSLLFWSNLVEHCTRSIYNQMQKKPPIIPLHPSTSLRSADSAHLHTGPGPSPTRKKPSTTHQYPSTTCSTRVVSILRVVTPFPDLKK